MGLARKIGFDLALPRLSFKSAPPLLVSLDADTLVRPDYLPAILKHFQGAKEGGAVIPFCHQRGENPEQEAAIQRYELFLRSYVLGLERAGSPYAFHTVGSAMACRAEAYARMGGMNHREAGEDFYFLQHLAKTAGVGKMEGTVVYPSPRVSHRVPFGTGPSMSRLLAAESGAVLFYRPECFQILKDWLALVSENLESEGEDILLKGGRISEELGSYLTQIQFAPTWEKLKKNFHAPPLLLKAFHDWFDGLKTLKLIHHLSAGPYPRAEPEFGHPGISEMGGFETPWRESKTSFLFFAGFRSAKTTDPASLRAKRTKNRLSPEKRVFWDLRTLRFGRCDSLAGRRDRSREWIFAAGIQVVFGRRFPAEGAFIKEAALFISSRKISSTLRSSLKCQFSGKCIPACVNNSSIRLKSTKPETNRLA